MPRLLYTTDNLIDEIRQQIDEQNQDSVSTTTDILPTLNRAQDYAFDILARKYPEPILAHKQLTLLNNVSEYDIGEEVFEDRILKVEVEVPYNNGLATYREVRRISYRDISDYESASLTNMPYYYCVIGRKIRLVGTPTGIFGCRIWYLRNPEKLVQPQGRITILNTTSNYVIVDSAGSSLTTESDLLGSYVNVIDGQTGEIKCSLQISLLDGNKVTFRTVPTRASVLNRTISGTLTGFSIEQDDYLSPIDGICVPYYGRPVSNFLIQYSVAEITRKLGGSADMENQVLDKFEKQVERTWNHRESSLRVKKRSNMWNNQSRRWYFYGQY